MRSSPQLAYAVQNVMNHLGKNWKLHVVIDRSEVQFVLAALSAAMNEYSWRDTTTTSTKVMKNIKGSPVSELPIKLYSQTASGSVDLWVLDAERIDFGTAFLSSIMKSNQFWDAFPQEGILVFQVDSIMLSSASYDIYDFVKYDYIGAPWCLPNNIMEPLVKNGTIKRLIGNGGFSWRRKTALKTCFQNVRDSIEDEPEDRYFMRCFSQNLHTFKIPTIEIARQFSVEVPCWDIHAEISKGSTPLALHAAWYYTNSSLWITNVL